MLLSFYDEKRMEAGCDEAGRGCIAGPVVASAVILPKDFSNKILNDSKKLSEKNRYELRKIIENEAIDFSVEFIFQEEIDKINILNASIKAMHKCIDSLKKKPEILLIDGNRFKKYKKIPYKCIIKGDSKYMSIASASILAKTYRDDFMKKLHEEFPLFDWDKNKGYPTSKHKSMLNKENITPYHRKSFSPVKELVSFIKIEL